MDRIDVLGERKNRFSRFSKELLAETNDAELQEIVQTAASELSSPIALVSLVLDQIQFFKAFVGLPPVLEASRGTHRDVSFCQFVVRDGKTFEVNDAPNDPRIPQHLVKEYNIQSYLGVPILVEEDVVGSLCVIDTKKREFSKEEHTSLIDLSKLVNMRLKVITKNRRQTRLNLTEATLNPALTELSYSLIGIQNYVKSGYTAAAAIRSFLKHSEHLFSDKTQYSDAIRLTHEAAMKANQLNEDLLHEIELAATDNLDCISALEHLVLKVESSKLSEIVIAAQDLSRSATKLVGGFSLPDFQSDPVIYTKGNLAIAIVTNCLLSIASELAQIASTSGIELNINEHSDYIELLFSAKGLNKESSEEVVGQLKHLMGSEHPTIIINLMGEKIRLIFNTIDEKVANKN